MENALQHLPPGARVAIIRLRSLGDCVLTTPALHLLKTSRSDLKVAVIVEERFGPVFRGNPDVDELLPPSVQALRGWSPQLCLDLHGGPRSALLVALSGAKLRAGFAHFRAWFAYNIRIPTAQQILGVGRKVHTAEHLASAVFYLGVPVAEVPRARLFASCPNKDIPYAIIHPYANGQGKTWPARGFLAVARKLELDFHLKPVFIAGPGEDLRTFQEFRTLVGVSLEEVKNLMAGASVFVGNDSGPAHMAAAFGLPVLVLFGASDPVIWGPWKTVSEVVVAPGSLEKLAVENVLQALDRLKVAA